MSELYQNPMQSGRDAFKAGKSANDNPISRRTHANAALLWDMGFLAESTKVNEPVEHDLIARIDSYGFECEGGPLSNCVDWHRLRAEVASLKEDNEQAYISLAIEGVRPSSLSDGIADLTQQLAAANGRVERMREIVRLFVGASYPVDTRIDERGHRWSETYLAELLPMAQAALSSLPQSEDAARLDWIQHEVDSGGMFALEKFGGSWVKLFTASTQHMKQKPSVRAAIDAAMSAQENKS